MEKVNTIDLSIIILSYKSKKHLEVLLPSIFESRGTEFVQFSSLVREGKSRSETEGPESSGGNPSVPIFDAKNGGISPQKGKELHSAYTAEVIVVDNGSNDGTYEWLYNLNYGRNLSYTIRSIKNQNTGFANGNNIGIKQSSGKYILLLNADTRVQPETFKIMLDFMEQRADVGMATCKLVKPDGSLDLAARRNFPNPWNSFLRLSRLEKLFSNGTTKSYNITDTDPDQEMEIESLVGAFLLTRKSLLDKIGLLDEDFFMYGEDLDWCWRCKEAGFKVWYYPKTTVVHYKGESSKQIPFKALKWFHDAMWIFYKKHYSQKYPFFFNWLVWLGIYGRLTALSAINFFKSKPVVSK